MVQDGHVLEFWKNNYDLFKGVLSQHGKRILVIGPVPPPYGGVATHISVLRKHMSREGFEFRTVYMYKLNPRIFFPNMLRYIRDLLWADVVYDNSPFWRYPYFGLFTLILARIFRKRYILHVHSGNFEIGNGLRGVFRRLLFRFASAVIVGRPTHARLVSPLNDNVYTIYSLFNIDFPDESVLPGDVRRFVHSHSPILLSVGGMNRTYSFRIVVDAFAELLKKYPNAGLILVYGTSSFDRKYYDKLLSKIQAHKISDSVLLLADFPHTNALYPLSDVFIRATTHDSTPLSIYEAAAAGCKVLASDVVERPEFAITVRNFAKDIYNATLHLIGE